MNRSRLVPDRIYYVRDSQCYAVSPDGVGVYWYDSMGEVFEAHGTGQIHYIDHISDF